MQPDSSATQTVWRRGRDSNSRYRSEWRKSRRLRKLQGINLLSGDRGPDAVTALGQTVQFPVQSKREWLAILCAEPSKSSPDGSNSGAFQHFVSRSRNGLVGKDCLSTKHPDPWTQQVWSVVHAVKKAETIFTETLKCKQKTALIAVRQQVRQSRLSPAQPRASSVERL